MHTIYNVVFIGIVVLMLYIVIDFIWNKTKNLSGRIIYYSFIFYLLIVGQFVTNGIIFPPETIGIYQIDWIPFNFMSEWLQTFQSDGFSFLFWNSVKITLYDLLIFIPFGVYLSILYQLKSVKYAFAVLIFSSLTLELFQALLSYFGFILSQELSVDDILLNLLGGIIGFSTIRLIKTKE